MDDQQFKADGGKPDHSLLELGFPNALAFVQATLDYGAKKYEAHSWRNVPNGLERYDKAARRHKKDRDLAMAWYMARGAPNYGHFTTDQESGLPHIAHELFNLMAVIELVLQKNPDIDVSAILTPNEPPQEHKNVSTPTTS